MREESFFSKYIKENKNNLKKWKRVVIKNRNIKTNFQKNDKRNKE